MGRGDAGRSSGRVDRSHDALVKNCWRHQSTRGKVEGEIDNDCQDNCTDNAGQGAPKVFCNQHEGAQSERDNADDDCGLGNRLGLDLEGKFHAPKQGQDIKKTKKNLRKREEKAPV